jgi:hypothetical protein
MNGISEEKQRRKKEIDEAFASLEEKDLAKWYGRWRNEPWTYAVVKTFQKIPFYLLIVAVVSWEKIQPLFTHPFVYLKERIPVLLLSFMLFTVIFHFAWRSKAMHYYLLAKTNANLVLRDDDRVNRFSRKASERLVRQYKQWGQRRWHLCMFFGLVIPFAFFSILYLINGLKENQWSPQAFFSIFEGGTDFVVFAIFFFFGALMGNGIWTEINRNYRLLLNANKGREF